ncbi:MAG TPA: UDP-3-O-(3-hydroxymyristoyl)glucosamine N-acyltransferase [Abditibacteriaceae bacterium]|nr:UDP-3-O-(3-hydroxymyristoyl)glucosamine N-acyltransferase [Abditibacteriaceae bacterium]
MNSPNSTTASNGHATPATAHSDAHTASVPPLATPDVAPMRQATVGDLAKLLNAQVVGDAKQLITGVASLDSATPGTISFIEHERLLKTALNSSATAIIAPSAMAAKMRRIERTSGKPVVLTGNPRLAFAKVMEYLQPLAMPDPGIHPAAVIEADAYIGEGVTVHAFCYVGHHAHIGAGVVLYPHVVIGDGAQIGNASVLHPSVVINHHVHVGERVRIHSGSVLGGDGFGYVMHEGKHHKVPQIGTVIIEDDVEIGANVCIDRATMGATRVGAGTKIDNLVQVAHNVQIGRNCLLCAHVGLSGSVIIEDDVVLAGQIGVRDHIKIGKGAIIGAQSGVMNDIEAGGFMLGSPAVTHREFMKMEAAARKLPEALRNLRNMERQMKRMQEQLDALHHTDPTNGTSVQEKQAADN